MKESFTARAEVDISADIERVWGALTDPSLIKQYLFGAEAVSDWKKGSPITYRGVWEGKAYEDKGVVLEVSSPHVLKTTYWSALSGLPDSPENYSTVEYRLAGWDGRVTLSVTQDNNPSREAADHSRSNWQTVLGKLKELVEGNNQ